MQRIVFGYDGTATAARAATEAAALARAMGAELHIVRVMDEDRVRHGMITADEQERSLQRATTSIQQLLDSDEYGLAVGLTGVATVTDVLSGPPSERLNEYAGKVDADLLVVGNRRVQGIERVLGSVAIAVLRHAPCSVYVAHTAEN